MDKEEILSDLIADTLVKQAHERRFIYKDLENLLIYGFLSHNWEIENLTVTFKSLTPYEERQIGRGLTGHRYLGWYLAYSVHAIEGHPISTEEAPYVYETWIRPLPLRVVEELYLGLINPFLKRIGRCQRIIEGYCYEIYSRQLWVNLGKPYSYEINSKANVIFQWWAAYNHMYDKRMDNDRQWTHTRTIVAAMSGEGAKKLWEAADRDFQKQEEKERRIIEKTVNWVIQGDKPKEKVFIEFQGKKLEVQQMHFAATFDELREEMRKVFDGDKDYHDVLVDDYYAKIRAGVKAKRKEARQKSRRSVESLPITARNLVGYTEQQLKELRPDLSRAKTTSMGGGNPEFDHVYSRYIENEIKPGVLGTDMKVKPSDRIAEKKKDLMERISSRRPDPFKTK